MFDHVVISCNYKSGSLKEKEQSDGFGNHDPGSGRYNQKRSVWDQVHPGRSWATRMSNLAIYDVAELRSRISARHHAKEVAVEKAIEEASEK